MATRENEHQAAESESEAELRRRVEALEEENRELAAAAERGREWSRVVGHMGHELRTPLNSILGFSKILSDKLRGRIEPREETFLDSIFDSGERLLGMINDLVDLSKIEAGEARLDLDKISIGDLARGIRGVLLGVANQRRVDLELDLAADLPLIVADGPKVKQILFRLVSKALETSPGGSAVTIGARPLSAAESPLDAPTVAVTVASVGDAPLSSDMMAAERFTALHGGTLDLGAPSGEGRTFRLYLPVDASAVGCDGDAPDDG